VSEAAGTFDAIDVSHCSAEELEALVEAVRGAQASIDAVLLRIGVRAEVLAATGNGPTASELLTGRGHVRARTARREAARAQLAAREPALHQLLAGGNLGPDHLDSVTRRLGSLEADALAGLDIDGLLAGAERLPADTFDATLRRAVETARDDGGAAEARSARAASELRHWFDRRTGLGHLSLTLDPERYEALVTAVDQHTATLAANGSPGCERNAHLAAEALVDLACSSGARSHRLPHITVVVDEATLVGGRHQLTIAETADGQDLADHAIARLCCDAVLQRVVLGADGVPIDVGRRYRTATSAQWAALRSTYRSCGWSGCDRPLSHCQAHHLRTWQAGGATDLDNLVPLCSQHHHLVHEGNWQIDLLPDRSLRINRPDGRHHRTTDPPTRRPPPLGQPCSLTTAQR
jgi:hypothetical protein